MRAIFCNISIAFDRVWHKGLLYKLQTVGITGRLLQWFSNYLNNRKQRVVLPGVLSHWANLKAGVIQGSIIGPLLFLIYINDFVRKITSSMCLFADDTSLNIIVENLIQSATILNSDLSQIYTWASNWLVTFNPPKTESLLFSRKLFKPLHPTLYMNTGGHQRNYREIASTQICSFVTSGTFRVSGIVTQKPNKGRYSRLF